MSGSGRRGPGAAGVAVAAGLLCALAALAQLLVPPGVVMADNGDFGRVACRLHVAADAPPGTTLFFAHGIPSWHAAPPGRCLPFTSSSLPLLRLARALTPGDDGGLDLHVAGAVQAVLLGVCVAALVAALPGRARTRAALAAGLLMVLLDSSRTAYFPSLYSEPASLLGLLLLLAAVAVSWRRLPVLAGNAVVAVAAVPLVLSKPQHAPLAAVVAVLLVLRVLLAGRHRRVPALLLTGALGAALLAAAATYYVQLPADLRRPNTYNIVFYEVLRFSPDPAADARELGVDPALLRYAGTSYFGSPDSHGRQFEAFYRDVGAVAIGRFYAHHPQRALSLYARAARDSFDWLPDYLGTFPASSGRPSFAQACRPCALDRLAAAGAPAAPGLLAALWAGAAAAGVALLRSPSRDDRSLAATVLVLDAVAVTGFATATLGSGDYELAKHLFLVGVADALLVVLGAAAAVRLVQRRRSGPSRRRAAADPAADGPTGQF